MTFSTNELSAANGRPVELLLINYSMRQWAYTTAEVPITYNLKVYEPLPIRRGSLQQSGDASKSQLTVSIPRDNEVGELFRVRPPSEVVTVTVFAEHYLDNDFQTIWKGRIVSASWNGNWIDLVTENVFSSLKRIGLRRRYSSQCGHVLYGPKCNLARETFRIAGPVSVISGNNITVPAAAAQVANYFAGGYAAWSNATTNAEERMMILSSSAGVMTVETAPTTLIVGQGVSLFPGCTHDLTTCGSKFNNALNFGGYPFIPKKNPFAGSSIY